MYVASSSIEDGPIHQNTKRLQLPTEGPFGFIQEEGNGRRLFHVHGDK